MPKKTLSINKFEKGILNAYDRRDIPEGGMSNLRDVLCDISGQLRAMGSEIIFDDPALSASTIPGMIRPGRGLFAFEADYSVSSNKEVPSRILAIQKSNTITLFDWSHKQKLLLDPEHVDDATDGVEYDAIHVYGGISNTDKLVDPVYIFIDGVLYVSDADFTNQPEIGVSEVASIFPKEFRYIRKRWFSNLSTTNPTAIPSLYNGNPEMSDSQAHRGTWLQLQSPVFPPSVTAAGTNTHQLFSATDLKRAGNTDFPGSHSTRSAFGGALAGGNIALSVAEQNTSDTGDWMAGIYHFGISFQYDDGRESLPRSFVHPFTAANDNVSFAFELYIKMVTTNDFDARVAGINLYWSGDDSGMLDDPLWLGYWHWGSNDDDLSYFESHEGVKLEGSEIEVTDGTVISTTGKTLYIDGTDITKAGLEIKTQPELSFELRNGYDANSDTVAARYSSAVVSQRKMWIGGVERVVLNEQIGGTEYQSLANTDKQSFFSIIPKNLDRLMYSPENQFSIFPSDNFIDVTINDGDAITHLEAVNDKILQFKKNKLFIINIATEDYYTEGEYDYLGVEKSYQVVKTELGVAWINKLGCYFYTGSESPINITRNNLQLVDEDDSIASIFTSWGAFIKSTGMIGYLPQNKQLVIFEDPSSSTSGDILIYDMQTKSWTFGAERVSLGAKSNLLSNWNNKCLYVSNQDGTSGGIDTRNSVGHPGEEAQWYIQGCNGVYSSPAAGTYLKIGTTFITDLLTFTTTLTSTGGLIFESDMPNANNLLEYLMLKIVDKVGYDTFHLQVINSGAFYISRAAEDIDGTYTGNLTLTSSLTISGLAITEKTITNMKNLKLNSYNTDGYANTDINLNPDTAGTTQLNMGITGNADYSSGDGLTYINLATLLHHSSLATFIPLDFVDYPNDEFYNPFNIVGVPTVGAGSQFPSIPSSGSRRLLNVDTTNYSKITITGASNYAWATPGTTLVLSFGHGAANSSGFQYVDGLLGPQYFRLFGYPIASSGTEIEAGADANFYVTGQPLETGSKLTSSVTDSLNIDIGSMNNSVIAPSVVYRKFSEPDELHVSILGDWEDSLSVNTKYNIYGGGQSGGATHAQSGGVNDLRKFKLNEVKVYKHGGDYIQNGSNDQDSFTVLIFKKSEQDSSDTGTNEPFASGKWDSIKSYGDMCIAGDMSIALSSTAQFVLGTMSGSGVPSSVDIAYAHPYITDRSSLDTFLLSLKDDNAALHTASYAPLNSNSYHAINVADELVGKLQSFTPACSSLVRVDINGPEVQAIQVSGDWTKLKINQDLRNVWGVRPGDIFQIAAISGGTISYTDSVVAAPTSIYKIDTIEDYGVTTAGYTYLTIDTNIADSLILTELAVIGSGGTTTTLAASRIKFSNIKVQSSFTQSATPISLSGQRIGSIKFLEYANTKHSVNAFLPSKHLLIETPDIDFDTPGNEKKIYYLDISYQYTSLNDTSNSIRVSGIINNKMIQYDLSSLDGNVGLPPSDSWRTERLYFYANQAPLSCTSLRIRIDTFDSTESINGFKLNDISISYRDLNR